VDQFEQLYMMYVAERDRLEEELVEASEEQVILMAVCEGLSTARDRAIISRVAERKRWPCPQRRLACTSGSGFAPR
jgi:hypothetical protein